MTSGLLEITPLAGTFAAKVTGVRLATLDAPTFARVYAAWLDHGVLLFPGQFLSRAEQVAVAQRFGPIEFANIPISNVRDDGRLRPVDDPWLRVLKGNQGWHIDSTYVAVQSKGALLSAHVVTRDGGETEWADAAAGYDALSPELQARVSGLSAFHSIRRSQALIGDDYQAGAEHGGYGADAEPPLRPLVKTHPETGRRSLVIGRHAYGVPGLTPGESERLLEELLTLTCQQPRTFRHAWTPGDVVIWDNRRTLHRGLPWDMAQPRVLHHTRIAGDPTTEFASAG
ncbi:MAG: TauD/TfdA family dioxygenase [Phenylobacterium sp.]|nr:TauD/TfdA family dioxygenase [Phenylobacterium sp.]